MRSIPHNQGSDAELLEDRALSISDQDRLGHIAVVDELSRLVDTVPTPSTIGLFGSWGAGKSGIGSLLRERLNAIGEQRPIFVRVDAFRNEGVALSREFLREVAAAIDPKSGGNVDDYTITKQASQKSVTLERRGWFILSAVIFGVFLLASGALIWSAIVDPNDAFWKALGARAPQLLPAILPGALIGAIAALFGKQLSVETQAQPLQETDEFGRAYEKIIRSAGNRRVVVFIDELDRCSADQVVTTLNKVRTFLDVDGCIYVVAIDQQVAELAAREAASQVTPPERSNLNHSPGSSYIDKVFQYRINVPAVRSRRLTRFATELVESLGGIWTDFDRGALIQVLLPTHVTSPRRVKALINAFAVAYRILGSRAAAGFMPSSEVPTRALELAKLTALRVEFPLFAEDLARHPDLAKLVLFFAESDNDVDPPSGYRKEVVRLAKTYAALDWINAQKVTTDSDGIDADEATSKVPNDLLVAYLKKTNTIQGPRRDLIFLEDSGFAFDLPGDLAEAVESDAANGLVEDFSARLPDLTLPHRLSVARLVAQQLKETGPGVEGINVLAVLGRSVREVNAVQLAGIAAEVISSVPQHLLESATPETVGQLFRIAVHAGECGEPHVEAILKRSDLVTDLGISLQELVSLPGMAERDVVAQAISQYLLGSTPEEAIAALHQLRATPEAARTIMYDGLVTHLVGSVVAALKERDQVPTDDPTSSPNATKTTSTILPAEAIRLRQLVRETSADLPIELREVILAAALLTNNRDLRKEVHRVLPRSLSSHRIIDAVFLAITDELVRSWPTWLHAIGEYQEEEVLSKLDRQAVLDICLDLEEAIPSQFIAALAAVNLLRRPPNSSPSLDKEFRPLLASSPDEETAAQIMVAAGMASAAIDAGRLPVDFSDLIITAVERIFEGDFSAGPNFAEHWMTGISYPDPWLSRATAAQAERLARTISNCGWIQELPRNLFILRIAATSPNSPNLSEYLSTKEFEETLENHPDSSERLLQLWVSSGRSTEEVWRILENRVESRLSPLVFGALKDRVEKDRGFRTGLMEMVVKSSLHARIDGEFIQVIVASRLPLSKLKDLIGKVFDAATTNDQRDRVLRTWLLLGVVNKNANGSFIDRVLLPTAAGNKGGLLIASKYLVVLTRANAHNRTHAREELLRHAKRHGGAVEDAVEVALEKIGLLKRRKWSALRGFEQPPQLD